MKLPRVWPYILGFILLFGICNILFKEEEEVEHGWDMHETNCIRCDEVRKDAKAHLEAIDQQIQLEFWLEDQERASNTNR